MVVIFYITNVHSFGGTIMQDLKEFSYMFLALCISIGLVEQLKHANENIKALRNYTALKLRIEKEFSEDLDSGLTEIAVAKRDQEMVLHFR